MLLGSQEYLNNADKNHMLADASGHEEETSQKGLHSNTDNEASSRVLHGQQNAQTVVKKLMSNVFTAKLMMRHLDRPCMVNRMYTGTVVKKLMYDAYTARPTKKCLQGPCMVNRMYTETVVKKLMYDAYTARPTKKCLQGSHMDNRIKKLL